MESDRPRASPLAIPKRYQIVTGFLVQIYLHRRLCRRCWLADKSVPLIPQPLLPRGEKGSKKVSGAFKAPLPPWERGLG